MTSRRRHHAARAGLGVVLCALTAVTLARACSPSQSSPIGPASSGPPGLEADGPATESVPATEIPESGTDAPADPPDEAAPEPSVVPTTSPRRSYLLDRLAAGASLGWFTAEQARVLSEIHFDFPFLVLQQQSLYMRGVFETSTVKNASRLRADSFQTQDIEYLVEVGARDYLNNRIAIAAFLGQQGRRQLDGQQSPRPSRPEGSSSLRYVGVGFESAGFPKPGENRFEWRLATGAALHHEGIEADAVVRGALLYDLWRFRRSSIGLDGSFDSLFDRLSGQTEYRVGPRWTFPLPNGVRATLFAEWIRGNNPLLLDTLQGWNFGFRYTEGAYAGPHTQILPDVTGVLFFARGNERGFGRFALDLSSSEIHVLSKPGRVFANLDANVIGGTGVDSLYYVATVGIEASLIPRLVFGPRIYHRSNHTLGGDPHDPTALNIVQLSLRTPGWEYGDRLPGALMPDPGSGWLDRVEGCLVPGMVTNSAFTNARSWNLQVGARVDLSDRRRAIVPFVRAFGEWGGVDRIDRRELSLGLATRQNLVVEVRYRRDSQYFGDDDTDVFLAVSLYF